MEKEKLEIINTDYMLKKLAIDLKDLDKALSQYLINDMYNPKKIRKEKLFDEISYIKNMLLFIDKAYNTENNKTEKLYDLYDIQTKFEYYERIRNVWQKLLQIKENIIKVDNIDIVHDKGFDFDFGISNFSTLTISYIEKKNTFKIINL